LFQLFFLLGLYLFSGSFSPRWVGEKRMNGFHFAGWGFGEGRSSHPHYLRDRIVFS